jgi:LAO/AO transport system kinase
MGLAQDILKGNERSAARLISLIEDGSQDAYEELSSLLCHTGEAHVVGVTGPAGAGKSTLVGGLAVALSEEGKKVGVVATDPSGMNGGALLGDRIRMKEAAARDVFIRSMADRGHAGGLARAAAGAVFVMEALGKETILVESVGAGQSEKGLFHLCDTIVVIFTRDYGDEIQLLKAGLMEIGDVVVVNKGDLPGTEDARRELEMCASTRAGTDGWVVPVLVTRADRGEGLSEVAKVVDDHWRFLGTDGRRKKREDKTRTFVEGLLKEEMWSRFC